MKTSAKIAKVLFVFSLMCVMSASTVSAEDHNSIKTQESHDISSHKWMSPSSHRDLDVHEIPLETWTNPQAKTICCLLCIHGLGLNSKSFESFGKHMARHGVITYAIDVRGFGRWLEIEGHEDVDFTNCLEDINRTLQTIKKQHPGLPVFLLGESMGGAIALRATAMYPELIDGLVSSVPGGDRFKQKKTDLKVALQFLTGRNRKQDIGKSVIAQATSDEDMRQHWENDPLNRTNLSAKELLRFQKFMNENHEMAKRITRTPVLFVQGSEDQLVKPEGTWELFNEQPTRDKTFIAVPYEHLIFEEQEHGSEAFKETSAQLLITWLFAHVPNNAGANPKDNHSHEADADAKPVKEIRKSRSVK